MMASDEIELKLVVLDPLVLDELAARSRLADYDLHPQPTRSIRYRYWDTSDARLGARRLSLRLRGEDGALKLTVKAAGSSERGLFRHPELEVPADAAGWRTIRAELARAGQPLRGEAVGPDPLEWLRAACLVPTQDRRTARRVLLAVRDGRGFAELALDETTYNLPPCEVRFREIEVESLTDESRHVLAIGAALEAAFAGRVEPSDRNKYGRGLELGRRLGAEPGV